MIESGSPECTKLANDYLSSDKSPKAALKLANGVLAVLDAQDELLSERMRDFVANNIEDKSDVDKLIGLIDARDERVLEAFESFYLVMSSGGSQEEGQEILISELSTLARGAELFAVDAVMVDEEGDDDYEVGFFFCIPACLGGVQKTLTPLAHLPLGRLGRICTRWGAAPLLVH